MKKKAAPQYFAFYNQLGENIQKYRQRRKLSQERLANIVGLTRTSLTNIEKGRQHPPLHTLCEILEQLKVDISDVLPRTTAINEPSDIKTLAMMQVRGEKELAFIETAIKGGTSDGYKKKQDSDDDRKASG